MGFIDRVLEHKIFQVSILIKGIYGILEAISGILVLLASQRTITMFVQMVFGQELVEDPYDFFGNFFMNAANNLSVRMHVFIGLFIVVHGLVNIGIALALYYKRLWAFPTAGILMGLFIIYQVYQIIFTHSILMIVLTIIDIIILSLLRFEYERQIKLTTKSRAHHQ